MKFKTTVAIAVVCAALMLGATSPLTAQATPLVIQPGQDGFVTKPGTDAPLPSLPAGFFGDLNGTESDATAATEIPVVSGPDLVALVEVTTFMTDEGCHLHPEGGKHCYEQKLETLVPIYDTVIQRAGGTIDNEGDPPLPLTIEFVHLSLASASPFEVTYGAEGSLFYDILIELDDAQSEGTLILNRTKSASGTMDTFLPVKYQVTFTEVGGPREFSVVEDLSQASTGNTWRVVRIPTVSEWGLIVMTLLVLTAGTVVLGRRRRLAAA